MTNELPGMWDKSDLTGGQTDCDRATQEKMREFEQWYVENAFDYVSNPIGSRDCGLQRKAWQACAARSAETIARQSDIIARLELELCSMKSSANFANYVIARLEEENDGFAHDLLHSQENEQHWVQMAAAAKADNARLRKVLNEVDDSSEECEGDDGELVFSTSAEAIHVVRAALAQPLDTSALEAYVAKKTAWQPIETAPKDGTFVLVANRSGAWIACYRKYSGSGFEFPNPWMSMMLNHDHMERSERWDAPTNWMPLPPAPDKQGKGGAA